MKYPQDTSVSLNQDKELKSLLEQTFILEPLKPIVKIGNIDLIAILPKDKRYSKIKAFVTPVIINDETIIIDCRRGIRGNDPKTFDELPVTPLMYGALVANWLGATWSKQLYDNNAISRVFSYWVSDVIARRYDLGSDERAYVGALAMAFYLSKNPKDQPFDDKVRQICQRKCVMAYNAVIAQQVVGGIDGEFKTYDDFVRVLKSILGETKIEKLSGVELMRLLTAQVASILNSDILFATAFEYPPTFNTLIATIINNNFLQKSSPLGRVVATVTTKREGIDIETFLKQITGLQGKFSQ